MKLKILQDCRWAQAPYEPQLSLKKGQIISISDSLAKDMIKEGHAEKLNNSEDKLESSKKEDKLADTNSENKVEKEEKKSRKGRKRKKRGER